MSRTRAGGLFLMTGVVWSVLVIVVAGARYPGYSHVAQYISELGAHGARDGAAVSWAGFFVTGVLLGAGALAVRPLFAAAKLAALGVAVAGLSVTLGYVGSAAYRCDFGCPEENYSSTQSVHFAVSALNLIGVAVGIGAVAWALRRAPGWSWLARSSTALALLVLAGGSALLLPAVEDVAGLVQRAVELPTYLWFFVIGFQACTNRTEYAQGP